MKKLFLFLSIVSITIVKAQSGTASYIGVWSNMQQSASTGTTTWNLVNPNPSLPILIAKGTESWTLHSHKLVLPNYTLPKSDGLPDRLMFIDGITGEIKVSSSLPFDTRYKGVSYTPNSGEIISALGFTPYSASNPNNFISSYTETDPTIYAWAKALNKPTYTASEVNAYPLTGNPSGFLTGVTSTQINTALGFIPYNGTTNTNGYITSSSLTGYATTSSVVSGLSLKYDASNPSNYINQSGARTSISLTATGIGAATYNNTTGVINIPTPPTAKRQLTYSGTTDASGNYTVTFNPSFTVAPNIQQNLLGGNALQGTLVTSITTTGFTIQAYTRSTVSSLPVIGTLTGLLVGAATNPLVGGNIDVLITEK